MTTVDTATSTAAAQGTTPGAGASVVNKPTSTLNQQDFLKLLTAQLQNQDPLSPMDNAQFMGQMAQFSTVQGISQVNTTLSSIDSDMRGYRISTGAMLLGHQVLVPSPVTRADASGAVNGAVDLPEAASGLKITYSDATTGVVLHSDDLGAQSAGLVGFGWDSVPQDYRDQNKPIRVSISATTASGTADMSPSVYSRVYAAQASATTGDLTLQVQDYGPLNAQDVSAFR